MLSEARVAAALCVRGVELPATGVPFDEPPLPDVRCAVRTVDGVVGERGPSPCGGGARGVVLEPLSWLVRLVRGVVCGLPASPCRCVADLGLFAWDLLSFCRGDDLLAVFARLRVAPGGCICIVMSEIGGPSAAPRLPC